MAPHYIGIDAGGSGTRAALATASGNVLAMGFGGPSGVLGGPTGARQLRTVLADALNALQAPDHVVVHVGLRGTSIRSRSAAALAELHSHFPERPISISNDAVIAQWAALAGQHGVAVLAGTGSIALARDAFGHEARSGGYGYLVSDDGGAFWIGREAITACLQAFDGLGPRTALTSAVLEHTRQRAVPDLVAWLYRGRQPVERVAALAPVVSQTANLHDAVARAILERAGAALADLAWAAARQLWPTTPPDPLEVARCGGVWSAGAPLLDAFEDKLSARLPSARSIAPRLPPVGGALLLALRADGVTIDDGVVESLAGSLRRWPTR